MKKFIKIMNVRLNKPLLIMGVVLIAQAIVATLSTALSNSAGSQLYGEYSFIDSKDIIGGFGGEIAIIAAVTAAIALSLTMVVMNDIRNYLPQGIRRSTNLAVNTISALFMAFMVTIISLFALILGSVIGVSIYDGYYISGSISKILFDEYFYETLIKIFMMSLMIYFLFAFLYKSFTASRLITLVVIGIATCLGIIIYTCLFYAGFYVSSELSRFANSLPGSMIIICSVLAAAYGGYALIELKGRITR